MLTLSKACSASGLSNDTAEPDLLLLLSTISVNLLPGNTPVHSVKCILMFSFSLTHFSVLACVDVSGDL